MGSFYSTCSITGMTLKDQRVARLLLLPGGYRKPNPPGFPDTYDSRVDMITGKGLLVSNSGCQGLFCAFGFPVFGRYYDYGRIDSIEETPSVQLLEEFFNISIEDILEACSDDRWITYGIIEYEEELAKKTRGEPFNEHRIENNTWRPQWIDKVKNVELLKLATFTDIRAEIYEEMSKPWAVNKYEDKFNKTILKEVISGKDRFGHEISLTPMLAPCNFIKEMSVDRKVFKTEITDLFWFLKNLSSMYRYLMPSNYGGQTVNFKLIRRLNNLSNKLLKQDISDYDVLMGDYSDED